MNTQIPKKYSPNASALRFVKNNYERQPPMGSNWLSEYGNQQRKYGNKNSSEIFELSFCNSTAFVNGKEQEEPVFSQKLGDFKKYLHDSKVFTSAQIKTRDAKVIRQHEAKMNLNNKMLEAHRKLEELKQTVQKHQRVKAEILAKADLRKTIHSSFSN